MPIWLAIVLAGLIVVLVVILDLKVASTAWRIVGLLCACLLSVAIVSLLPTKWRKRLGPTATAFVAASGTLSVFLVSPSASPAGPVLNAQAMARLVADGPFDQTLPYGLVAGPVRPTGIGDPSAAAKLNATQIPIKVLPPSPFAKLGFKIYIYSEVEVYPTARAAIQRAMAELRINETRDPSIKGQTVTGFCAATTPDAWICGGVRGNAYAETTLAPGANMFAGLTQEINSALLNYASDKAKLAVSAG